MSFNVCIYGAGAIGCWLGAQLHHAGIASSLVARGPHLQALQQHGLTLTEDGKTQTLAIPAFGEEDHLPVQDMIIVTLKAHSITAALDHLTTLIHQDTIVAFAVNGIPWWFFYGADNAPHQKSIESVDPGGCIWSEIGPERALGCVVYPAVELTAPGCIKHISDNRISVGEPRGGLSERTQRFSDIFEESACRIAIRRNIRNEIWVKLWGNVAFNPLSVLTGGTLEELATNSNTVQIVTRLMEETKTVGTHYGARFGISIEKRIAAAAAVGAHKTSMLQDYEQGKPLESAAMIDAMVELAELSGINVPTIRMMQLLLQSKLDIEYQIRREP